jgi:isopenicillin N synthase-like dioxygenase
MPGLGWSDSKSWLGCTSTVRYLAVSMTNDSTSEVPVIDVAPLVADAGDQSAVAVAIGRAFRKTGFFYVIGHGVSQELSQRLGELSNAFFAQDLETKLEIRTALAGKAWRGYFPVGDELTSGKPDVKEGLHFGWELSENDSLVREGLPLHGPNLFPAGIPDFGDTILQYTAVLTDLGHSLMRGVALSLGLEPGYFRERFMADPLTLFRIFCSPPVTPRPEIDEWGVGEHTDYGVLTILKQDNVGGLQVKIRSRWIDAPPVPNSFVYNIGDMLDRLTHGLYRSTPHRVQNVSGRSWISFPFFFDPGFDAHVEAIDLSGVRLPGGRQGRPLGPCQRARVRGHLRGLRPGQGLEGLSRTPAECRVG